MTRAMTGSDLHEDVQRRYISYLVSCIDKDGLFYSRVGPERPWDKAPEDWANIYGQGRIMKAMLTQYYADGNPEWLQRIRATAAKLAAIALYRRDEAYFPLRPGAADLLSYPKSGWKKDEIQNDLPQHIDKLPTHTMGVPGYVGGVVLALVRGYEKTGDEASLELAGKLVKFMMDRDVGCWSPDGYPRGITPYQHGQFRGHAVGRTMGLRGVLAYGIATNDSYLMNFARDGYEYVRLFGINRLGWFEEYTGKHSHETCGLERILALAIHLSEAGIGDYWDDIDGYVRNHLTEGQFIDLRKLKALNPTLSSSQEKLLEQSVGTFAGWGSPTELASVLMNCCMGNGSQALYYVWNSMLRYSDGTARINLLLNRASPWIDIDSYLPYEGKVVLHNKQAKRIHLRVPGWVDRRSLKCAIAGRSVGPMFIGNYLVMEAVPVHSTVVITFPIREDSETYWLDDYGRIDFQQEGATRVATYRYNIKFRANTAIEVNVDHKPIHAYVGNNLDPAPTYAAYDDRQRFRRNEAPTKTVERYAASLDIPSW